jgi:hypothetical protein
MSQIKWPNDRYIITLLGIELIVEPSFRGKPFIYLGDYPNQNNNIQWNTESPLTRPKDAKGPIWNNEMLLEMCKHFNIQQTILDGF